MSGTPGPIHDIGTLRAWFDITPDAMLAVDDAGRVIQANTRAEGMFGYSTGDLQGLACTVLLPDWSSLADAMSQVTKPVQAHEPASPPGDERVGRKRDGQSFPVEVSASRVATEVGIITLVSLRDISQTRRVRRALDRKRHDASFGQISRLILESSDYESAIQRIPELLATALEAPAIAILAPDRERATFHIRAATGLSRTTVEVLTSIFGNGEFVYRAFEDGNRDPVTAQSGHGEVSASINVGLTRTRYQHFALIPLFGRHEPLGILIALAPTADAFDRDKVAFLQSVATLLTAAVQRSHAEEQLAHAQRLDAVGQLTGGIAHDFNNLLTVVSGNLQLLELELPDRPQAREIIDGALRAVDRGAELTRKLLTFARRQSLEPRPVRPGPLLTDLGRMLTRTLGEAVAIRIQCPANVPAVYADPGELETALVNLALNARDAMPRGGRLSITAGVAVVEAPDPERGLSPGRYVSFKVGDTGSGMTPEVQARAVEPFFTTKSAGKGSGLGLSMVYGFVTQSGGCVIVDSRLGYGTHVEFLLPVAADASPTPPDCVEPGAPARSATVLVVEDEAAVRDIASAFLREMGYEILTAVDALSALQVLATRPRIELLFSDVVLGDGMTGVELAQEARRRHPGLAVLLVSGYPGTASGPPDTDTSASFPLLRKPYRREQLAGAVRAALDGG